MSAKILIVDDHEVVRQGIRSILADHPEWEICGELGSAEMAILAVSSLLPDVVIMDITMPGMSGLQAASRIAALNSPVRVLIFTMHESRQIIDDIREAGAHGYVPKSQAGRDLVYAVERLLAGQTFFGRHPGDEPGANPRNNAADKTGSSFCSTLCPA